MAEPTYTLQEAERIIAARECSQFGHSLDLTTTGYGDLIKVACARCGTSWATTPLTVVDKNGKLVNPQ